MLDHDPWLIDDELFDEAPDPFDTLPEVRHYVDADQRSDEEWMRSVLERPDALRKAWTRRAA